MLFEALNRKMKKTTEDTKKKRFIAEYAEGAETRIKNEAIRVREQETKILTTKGTKKRRNMRVKKNGEKKQQVKRTKGEEVTGLSDQ